MKIIDNTALFQIADLKIKINHPDDKNIQNYLNNEFGLFPDWENYDNAEIDLEVYIEKTIYKKIKQIDFLLNGNNAIIKDDIGYLKLNATMHNTYIKFVLDHFNKIKSIYIFLPLKTNIISFYNLFSPSCIPKWENCLVDIFHNVFLGIIELKLLDHNSSLIHASSFMPLASKQAIIFTGNKQIGKSTIIKGLSSKNNCNIISEDFCVSDSNKNVFAYPHRLRIYNKQIAQKNYLEHKTLLYIIINYINAMIFNLKPLKRFGGKRLLTITDFIPSCNLSTSGFAEKYYFLNRTGDLITEKEIDINTAAQTETSIIINELKQFAGFGYLLQLLLNVGTEYEALCMLEKKIYIVMKSIFANIKCYNLNIPYYETPELACNAIYNYIFNG